MLSVEKLFNIIMIYACNQHMAQGKITGSSFSAGVQQVFFPCCCAKGSSFPAGASQGILSAGSLQGLVPLLVLHKFPTLKFCHGNQTKWPLVIKHISQGPVVQS